MVLVFATGVHRTLTFENLALRRDDLHLLVGHHLTLALAAYVLLYVVIVALSLPGAGLVTIAGGMLFTVWLGAPATIVAATAGACVVYAIARTSLGAVLAERAGPWLDRFRAGFAREGLSYMLFLRLVPFPFFIINIVAAVLGVPFRTFLVGTVLGIVPATFAFSFLGDTLDRVLRDARGHYDACLARAGGPACHIEVDISSLPITQILVALTLLGLVALIPPLLTRWRDSHAKV